MSEEFFRADGSDKLLEIERLEVRGVFKPIFFSAAIAGLAAGRLRCATCVTCDRLTGAAADDVTAFQGAVADEEDGAFREVGGIALCIYDDGSRLGQAFAGGRKNGRIDFHPPCVDHRDDILAAFRHEAVCESLGHQGVQGPDRDQRQAGIGTGAGSSAAPASSTVARPSRLSTTVMTNSVVWSERPSVT